jgi:hypothetical protein
MNFSYKLIRSRRRSICLLIKEGEIVVRAPRLAPKIIIDRFVLSKGDWINKHLKKSSVRFKRQYKEGESFLFSGKEYQLKIIKTNLKSPEIRFNKNDLVALTYDSSKGFLKIQIEKFYRAKTQNTVQKLIKKYEPNFSGKVTIRSYRSKWGSCSRKNDLTFNTKLSMTPDAVIEYVVLHELSHIKEKNHSKRFWVLVKSSDEKYNEKRRWLRQNNDKLAL